MTYYVTHHAAERARLRFGIESERVGEWFNEMMSKAKYVSSQGGGRLLYEADGVQFIVGDKTRTVITVHPATRLDFLRPTLEREIRKIRREYTRNIRALERSLAGQYARLAEQMTNYANARNPQTRDLVGGRMEETERHIEGTRRKIERMEDEVKAKVKAIEVITE